MFLQMSAENQAEKSETGIKEIAIQMEILQKEINQYLQVIESNPEGSENLPDDHDPENTTTNLRLLEDILKKNAERLERTKQTSVKDTEKRRTERNVPAHWLFVR